MNELSIQVLNADGNIKGIIKGYEEITLVYKRSYQPGDIIKITASKKDTFLIVQVDDALGEAFVYVTKNEIIYTIPFNDKRSSYSPKVFTGERHLLTVRSADPEEISAYKNLALNVMDQHGDTGCYPHASANVETRGESIFAARNAIDGVKVNSSHGDWPYESWGINMQDDAEISVDFGRLIETDKIKVYTRADFPHDNWWKQITITFSDGSSQKFHLEKSEKPYILTFEKKRITWLKIEKLIKSDDPSPYPALTQIEVYGTEAVG